MSTNNNLLKLTEDKDMNTLIQKNGLFIIDNVSFKISDKTGGQFPNLYSENITVQLFKYDDTKYQSKLFNTVNDYKDLDIYDHVDICIYIPDANTILTVVLTSSKELILLLGGEEAEIKSFKIYGGGD